MNIIKSTPNPSGAYPPIQSFSGAIPPDGFYQVADGVTLTCGGFGTLTITDGIVTAFTGDETAWATWQSENPEPEPQPTMDEKLTSLEQTTYLFQQATLAYLEGLS